MSYWSTWKKCVFEWYILEIVSIAINKIVLAITYYWLFQAKIIVIFSFFYIIFQADSPWKMNKAIFI